MKIITNKEDIYFLRFYFGEELMQGLIDFCKENNINAGVFQVIGGAKEITVSFYNLEEQEYKDREIKEDLEIVSLTGNIGLKDGKIMIHAHGVFSKKDFQTLGGHIKSLVVSGTGEVVLTKLPENSIVREHDNKTGLNLIK